MEVEGGVDDTLSGLRRSNKKAKGVLNVAEMILPPGESDRDFGQRLRASRSC